MEIRRRTQKERKITIIKGKTEKKTKNIRKRNKKEFKEKNREKKLLWREDRNFRNKENSLLTEILIMKKLRLVRV